MENAQSDVLVSFYTYTTLPVAPWRYHAMVQSAQVDSVPARFLLQPLTLFLSLQVSIQRIVAMQISSPRDFCAANGVKGQLD